jgi:hypothetical protein
VPDTFYRRTDVDRYDSTAATRGPWSADHQHAGPPAALLGGALEDVLGDGRVTRLTFEVLRPVRLTPLRVEAEVVRPGRKVALAQGALHDEDGPVLLARAWRLREADVELPPDAGASMPPLADATPSDFFDIPWDEGYHTSIELRTTRGDFKEPGDAAVWFRSRLDITDAATISPLQRVLVAADSGNGISARFDPTRWLFVNVELSVHLRDHPATAWVGLDAMTRWGPDGIGLATSTLHGEQGAIGVAAQSLLVEPRDG